MRRSFATRLGYYTVAGATVVSLLRKRLIFQQQFITSASRDQTSPRILPRGTRLGTHKNNEISLVSYNVLCDKFATTTAFNNTSASILNFEHRFKKLQAELKEFDADIIALQEVPVLEDRFDQLRNFMKDLGYDGCIQQIKAHDVKLALFWRTSRCHMQWWEERSRALLAELKLHPRSSSSKEQELEEEEQKEEGQRQYNADSTDADDSSLFIINVHLEANPKRSADRISQIKHALQRLANHITTTSGKSLETSNVVVLGDYNSTSKEPAYVFLKQGELTKGFIDIINDVEATNDDIYHPFIFRDVYEEADAVPPFTRFVKSKDTDYDGAQLDFMLYSGAMEVTAVMKPLREEHEALVKEYGLPNSELPSDHLPIGAVLRMNTPQ